MKTKIITLISVLVLSCLAAFADGKTGVYTSKDADYDYATQKGTITLENYVGQVTKMIHKGCSADVVLIVDGSRSMGTQLLTDLKPAVDEFAKNLKTSSTSNVENRLSLIIFGGNAKMLCGYETVNDKASNYFGNLMYSACTNHITYGGNDFYCYDSGTMTHIAMGLAEYMINGTATYGTKRCVNDDGTNSTNSSHTWANNWFYNSGVSVPSGGARETDSHGNECKHYVVLMTDGALSGTPTSGPEIKSGNSGAITAMNQAVEVSKTLADEGCSVYSIGFLSNSDVSNQSLNNFLNHVSSNYPTATAYNSPIDYIAHDYYAVVDKSTTTAADALKDIFASFSEEIADGCAAIKFDESTTTVTDVLNNSYFKLPEGASASDIKIYTIPCTGYDATTRVYSFEGDETKWGHPTVGSGTTDIHVDVDESTGEVEVTNFNFTDNFCGMKYDTGTSTMKPHGCKLVIEIPFEVSEFSEAIGTVPTNAEGSGFTGDTDATVPEKFSQAFPSPEVDLYELNVTRSGLKNGESAIFTVTDEGGNDIYTIVLIGDGGTVSQKMLFVPAGKITVTETMWNSSTKVTKFTDPVISATNSHPTISFTGSSLGIKEDAKSNLYNK